MKKYMVIWGAMFFTVVCVGLYLMLEAVQINVGRFPDSDHVCNYKAINTHTVLIISDVV